MNTNETKKDTPFGRKEKAYEKIAEINKVEGFDVEALAEKYHNLSEDKTMWHLPVKAQKAWFLMKYPNGRLQTEIISYSKEEAVVKASIYRDYNETIPVAEAISVKTVTIGSSISILEWAETAAIGRALVNAGFGLQFDHAGDLYAGMEIIPQTSPAVEIKEGPAPIPVKEKKVAKKNKDATIKKEVTLTEEPKEESVAESTVEPVKESEPTPAAEPEIKAPEPVVKSIAEPTEIKAESTSANSYNLEDLENDDVVAEIIKGFGYTAQQISDAENFVSVYEKTKGVVLKDMQPAKLLWLATKTNDEKEKEAALTICKTTPDTLRSMARKGLIEL